MSELKRSSIRRVVACLNAALACAFVVCVGGSAGVRAEEPGLAPAEKFIRLLNQGKAHRDGGDAKAARAEFAKAVALHPSEPNARLNLAIAHLAANQPNEAIRHAGEALSLDRNAAAAHYIIGCAHRRLDNPAEAIQSLQQSRAIEPGVAAVSFQLARLYRQMNRLDEAIVALTDTIRLAPAHPSAHYQLGQLLVRSGRREEGVAQLRIHQQLEVKTRDIAKSESFYERCKHTQAVVPRSIDQPASSGVVVTFSDATEAMLDDAEAYRAPVGAIDVGRDGWIDLFVRQGGGGFRLLVNRRGTFHPSGDPLPTAPENHPVACLVGDLDNDRIEDCLVVGDK